MAKKELPVDVEANTNQLQRKLRAIAKHTEALAKELEAIDYEWECPACGSNEYEITEMYSASELQEETLYICGNCGHKHHEVSMGKV